MYVKLNVAHMFMCRTYNFLILHKYYHWYCIIRIYLWISTQRGLKV